jgi:carbon-monoxide dehydrogenase medium subunit
MALDASFVLAGPAGTRTVPATGFFTGPLTTVLADDEILVEVRVPRPPSARVAVFTELARRHGDFALVLVAAAVVAGQARVVVGGAGPSPLLVTGGLAGPDPGAVARLAEQAADECRPTGDVHATAGYRRHLVATLVTRALDQAARTVVG